MGRWSEQAEEIKRLLCLRGHVISVKFYEKMEDAEKVPRIRPIEKVISTCQRAMLARISGWTTIETADNTGPACSYIVGLTERPKVIETGELTAGIWGETQEDARKRTLSFPIISPPRFRALIISALFREACEPDVLLIYGTPAQMMMILNGLHWRDYRVEQNIDNGGSSCANGLVRCYLTGRPCLTIPDYAERRFAQIQDDEMVVALAPEQLAKSIQGIKGLRKGGIVYPIPSIGLVTAHDEGLPKSYGEINTGKAKGD